MRALVFVDSPQKYRFFSRLEKALSGTASFIYATNYLSLLLRARSERRSCIPIYRRSTSVPVGFYAECTQMLGRTLPEAQAEILAASATACFDESLDRYGCDLAIVWNGSRIAERALSESAVRKGVKRLFLEIGNFPGKLFADAEGVNAQSSLARSPEILDRLPTPSEDYYAWKRKFFNKRRSGANRVPQRATIKRLNSARLVDELGWWVLPSDGLEAPAKRLKRALLSVGRHAGESLPAEPFVFFPLQVSLDSQVLVNYGRSVYDGVCEGLALGREWGLPIVVKPHPSEPNIDPRLLSLVRSESALSICHGNTTELVEKAERVVTINSTVGLEALLLGKSPTILGKAFYKDFTQARADKYVAEYLRNIDYFSSAPIDPAEARTLIECAK